MEIYTMTKPSITPLAPVAASTAALVACPCATSAHAAALTADVQGISVRAWDAADVTVAVKRERTGADMALGFAAATNRGSSAWSPPI